MDHITIANFVALIVGLIGTPSLLQGCGPISLADMGLSDDEHTYFLQSYGEKIAWSWMTGILGVDTLTVGGKEATEQKFALMQVGNFAIANPAFAPEGPSVADGIIGMMEGDMYGKGDVMTDFLSTLKRNGIIRNHAFTLCIRKDGGGNLYLGRSSVQGKVEYDLKPMEWHIWHGHKYAERTYRFKVNGDSNSTVYFGDVGNPEAKLKYECTKEAMENNYLDTGSSGLIMPWVAYEEICNRIVEVVQKDSSVIGAVGDRQEDLFKFICKATESPMTMSSSVAAAIQELVPNLNIKLPDGKIITVLGSSFLFETYPNSGTFAISWNGHDDPKWIFGSAYHWGQSIQYDWTASKIISYGNARECTTDFSESGVYPVPARGVPGQVLGGASAIAVEIGLGTPAQKFWMYLDSGSAKMLLVDGQDCMMTGLPAAMQEHGAYKYSCFYLNPGSDIQSAQVFQYEAKDREAGCEDYERPFIQKLKDGGYDLGVDVPIKTLGAYMSETLQPYATCQARRAHCDMQHEFNRKDSQSFLPGGLPTYTWTQQPPPYNNPGLECFKNFVAAR